MTNEIPTGLVGNVAGEIELMVSAKGSSWTKFRISVQPWIRGASEQPPAEFYSVVAFGSLAENIAETFTKGDRIVVTGKLESEQWVGRDGVERTSQKLILDGCGPDLRFATTTVNRSRRSGPTPEPSTAVDEPVGTHPVQQAGWADEEPF